MAFLEALLGDDFRNLKDGQKKSFYFWFCEYLVANSANNHEVPKLVQQALSGDDNAREVLASHGYIVVSISANGIKVAEKKVPGVHGTTGMIARVKLIQKHLNIWKAFSGADNCRPFDDLFYHRVALRNIGLMGHSLGGARISVSNFTMEPEPLPCSSVTCIACTTTAHALSTIRLARPPSSLITRRSC